MAILPSSIEKLIESLSDLPGIGPKTASRLTFYLLTRPQEEINQLATAVEKLRENLLTCGKCYNFAESDPCIICSDPKRDQGKIMIVEEPLDVIALEKTGYNGVYHVLGGVISPIAGVGPEDLRIKPLLDKVKLKKDNISEIILATDPSLEGEATAMYLNLQIKKLAEEDQRIKKIIITRIARGLPVGGDLEYADEITLTRAIEGRKEY
jgi:recombination protein RecR